MLQLGFESMDAAIGEMKWRTFVTLYARYLLEYPFLAQLVVKEVELTGNWSAARSILAEAFAMSMLQCKEDSGEHEELRKLLVDVARACVLRNVGVARVSLV